MDERSSCENDDDPVCISLTLTRHENVVRFIDLSRSFDKAFGKSRADFKIKKLFLNLFG